MVLLTSINAIACTWWRQSYRHPVMNGYTLAFGGLLLLGGRAGDILGRRRMFLVGIAVFPLASLTGGLAQNAGELLAARVVQGVGGALASPAVLALVVSGFAEGRGRGRE